MRYTIGVSIPNKDGSIIDGLYVYDEYGLASIFDNNQNIGPNKFRIRVFSDLSDAQKFVKSLSKAYRKEFVSTARRYNLPDISLFKFYLVKVDSSKFNRTLAGEYSPKRKKEYNSEKMYYI